MAKSTKSLEVTGWVGWIGFACFMLLLTGFFSLVSGFVALFKDTVYVHAASGSVWVLDYTQWGWIHIALGLLALLAAASLAKGNMYGRLVAVILALISAVANMAFVPVYPVWSILVIAVDILVIYAVTVHGKEVKNLQ